METQYIRTQSKRYGELNVLTKMLNDEYENLKTELPFETYHISREELIEQTRTRIDDIKNILDLIQEQLTDIENNNPRDIDILNFTSIGEVLADRMKRMKGGVL